MSCPRCCRSVRRFECRYPPVHLPPRTPQCVEPVSAVPQRTSSKLRVASSRCPTRRRPQTRQRLPVLRFCANAPRRVLQSSVSKCPALQRYACVALPTSPAPARFARKQHARAYLPLVRRPPSCRRPHPSARSSVPSLPQRPACRARSAAQRTVPRQRRSFLSRPRRAAAFIEEASVVGEIILPASRPVLRARAIILPLPLRTVREWRFRRCAVQRAENAVPRRAVPRVHRAAQPVPRRRAVPACENVFLPVSHRSVVRVERRLFLLPPAEMPRSVRRWRNPHQRWRRPPRSRHLRCRQRLPAVSQLSLKNLRSRSRTSVARWSRGADPAAPAPKCRSAASHARQRTHPSPPVHQPARLPLCRKSPIRRPAARAAVLHFRCARRASFCLCCTSLRRASACPSRRHHAPAIPENLFILICLALAVKYNMVIKTALYWEMAGSSCRCDNYGATIKSVQQRTTQAVVR
ncbi:hypothetical protein TNIN_239711 [Trichonephila inaurata madagascariensis]|uniref:Uncharacterized protein n=1 Tax=Trichonephila inaurata madagascariensis TaxID=2747483 RepID=A0A8X6ML04_9ARAC|nr:hypothetical protein TNIN_239711 [Trichonephila inaurata madagascariensis]